MTAEIVIMNRSAVALAADSAVTVRVSDSRGKIFNTANKVFSLSKYAPVGIMISGTASIMGVPWEVIIKQFRDELKTEKYDTIQQYCERFFSYVDEFPFEYEAEEQHVFRLACSIFADINARLDDWVELQSQQNDGITDEDVYKQLHSQIEEALSLTTTLSKMRGILDDKAQNKLLDTYRDDLDNAIKYFFEKYVLSDDKLLQLRSIVIHGVSIGEDDTEIVIAGFGEKEYFPQCQPFFVSGVLCKHTIQRKDTEHQYEVKVGTVDLAAIIPFAQSDEVTTFLYGVSPYLTNFMTKTFQSIFGKNGTLPQRLFKDVISRLELQGTKSEELKKSYDTICQGAYEEAMAQFLNEIHKHHFAPILSTTNFLNKDELAHMAETLVNLESFRKQVNLGEETVGGPIDVAVITKGDGFIWIKRKHYFTPELNHHFFRNYFNNKNFTEITGDDQ